MPQLKIRYKILNPFNRSKLEEKYSELAYAINHNSPKYNGIRYARLNGISLHDVFSRAESIRATACVEERETILLRVDCMNALMGEGILVDFGPYSPEKFRTLQRLRNHLKKNDEEKPHVFEDGIVRINGSNRGELFYRTLKSTYGDDRFSSLIMTGANRWNGRGTMIRI
jgi:hypothetical protein